MFTITWKQKKILTQKSQTHKIILNIKNEANSKKMKKSNVSGKVKYLLLVLVDTISYCNIFFMFQTKKSD